MMQIFIREPEGGIVAKNVGNDERICSIKRKVKEYLGVPCDVHLGLTYNGQLVDDGHTVAHYHIQKESTLRLFFSHDELVESWYLGVKTHSEKRFTLAVTSVDTVDDLKAKIQNKKGFPPHNQLLFHLNTWLEDGHRTLADYGISTNSTTLKLVIQLQKAVSQSPNVKSEEWDPVPSEAPVRMAPKTRQQTKRARLETQTSTLNTNSQDTKAAESESSMLTELEELKREITIARSKSDAFEAECKKTRKELTVARKELEATISGLKAENKKTKEKLTVARNTEEELEATISELKAENKKTKRVLNVARDKEEELEATISRLKAENKKTKRVLNVARNKEKELEATISGLKAENMKTKQELTAVGNKEKQLEATITGLKDENKRTKQVLALACNKEKELEATISGLKAENKKTKQELTAVGNKEKQLEVSIVELMQKNKVFSAKCATYESQVLALEVENKKINEELVNADKKHYAAAKAVGYSEGLKEGKTKWLKSVEFLNHLTDASMQYFNHGFDSCQKQAEQQGFAGKLNKDSALKEAPNLKGWESNALQE